MADIGERLKSLRIKRGLTQEQLAGSLNLTKQAISRIEHNKNKYTDNEVIIRMAYQLKCTPDYLLGLSDDEHKLKNNKMRVVHFDPDLEIKERMYELYLKDAELMNLVLECSKSLNKNDVKVIKRVMQSLIELNKNNSTVL